MSCALLKKLAPETRTMIYEYALTFETPLKHVHKMRPFIEKSGQNTESPESHNSKTETSSSEESPAANDSFNRVNTSILTASKLIYQEAIAVFYKYNTITIDNAICKPENVERIRRTELALARQVITVSDLKFDAQTGTVVGGLGSVAGFAMEHFSNIFPKLKAATLYVYTDTHPSLVKALFGLKTCLRTLPNAAPVKFEGVGTVVAFPEHVPKCKVVLQCKTSVDRWANGKISSDSCYVSSMTMRWLHDSYERDPNGAVDPIAEMFLNRLGSTVTGSGYPPIEKGDYEFWTVADEVWHQSKPRITRRMETHRVWHIPRYRTELARPRNRLWSLKRTPRIKTAKCHPDEEDD